MAAIGAANGKAIGAEKEDADQPHSNDKYRPPLLIGVATRDADGTHRLSALLLLQCSC
jgi:hypothetical protein